MASRKTIARELAASFLADEFVLENLIDRGASVLGKRSRWLHGLAQRVVVHFGNKPRPRLATLARFLVTDDGFVRACRSHRVSLVNPPFDAPNHCPIAAARAWSVPAIRTSRQLAEWLGITISQLDWLADLKQFGYKQHVAPQRHYHYRPLTKRFGHIRLIEAPKPRLKHVQRQIHEQILCHIPPHEAAHGFRAGRSIKTFAAPHFGKCVVLKFDLRDFFPSIAIARVQALFRAVGYPETVADLLAGLCSNVTPWEVWNELTLPRFNREVTQTQRLYAQPHLPQGAPTSPALANLCAYRLDCRLAAVATAAGAVYTRYADDLAFSGNEDFARVVHRFQHHVGATVMEEGFRIHHRKTRIMRRGVRQRLVGLIVNEHLNLQRNDVDRLKATLTNCIRHGAESQNRDGHHDYRGHLNGRVAYVEMIHPNKGERLRRLFEQIAW